MTARLTAGFVLLGLLGCLRTFAPDLRSRGVHAGLPASSPNDSCMSCHESEADALARMRAGETTSTRAAVHALEGAAPLVADWMIAAPDSCIHCHRIRE